MSIGTVQYDVLLVYAESDRDVARKVKDQLTTSGLHVLDPANDASLGATPEARLRKAIDDSDAVVVVATPAGAVSPSLLFEIGAGTAWDKPTFVVRADVSPSELPAFIQKFPSQPISKLREVVRSLEASRDTMEWDDERAGVLSSLYAAHGVPTDRLAAEYAVLAELAQQFNRRTKRNASPEEVMRQLFTMRKRGRLPRLTRARVN